MKKGATKSQKKQAKLSSPLVHESTQTPSQKSSSSLIVFIPKEITPGETRVAATPETVKKMVQAGLHVHVEAGAGENSFISDTAYTDVGAIICSHSSEGYGKAAIVLRVNPPHHHPLLKKHELDLLSTEACWISLFLPQTDLDAVKKMAEKHLTVFSLNLLPRISRAQKMDVLTSQATVAGYKAVLMAASALPKFFPLLMTAAGTITPARVVILGAGVAGLQAIATAKRLGARVAVSDVRPAVKEQVQSLGAEFIEVPFEESSETAGGYAKAASPEFLKRQAAEVAKRIAQADVVITTALIPGQKAPVLVTADMVASMKPGSVIVDLAAEQGGNCALTEAGNTVVKHGVSIIGTLNVPGTVSMHATDMYARNILSFLSELVKDGKLIVTMEDEIIAASLVTHRGSIIHGATKQLLQKEAGGA